MTLRQHLDIVWQQTGIMPAKLADAPMLPEGCEDTWAAFVQLRSSCPSAGMGPGVISFGEVDAYQRVTGERLEPWQIAAIRAADRAYLQVSAEARS
jgi:hypothetical protein